MSMMRRCIFTVVKNHFHTMRQFSSPIKKHNLLMGLVACRMVSTQQLSKNIEIIRQDEPPLKISHDIENTTNKPLLVLLAWLFAKKRNIVKFTNLYVEQGFDVIVVNSTPWQLMWPVKGTRIIAKDLLEFLHEADEYQQVILHGFSIGGYMYGEVLSLILENREKYNHVIEKIVGQVWDSAVDVSELCVGTSRALFPENEVMRKLIQKYLEYHLKAFHSQATQYYIRSSQLFHTNLVHAPALFFVSKADSIGTLESNMRARDMWNSIGIPTDVKIFEKSGHVGHLRKYPKEYLNELYIFLDKLKLIKNKEKVKARL